MIFLFFLFGICYGSINKILIAEEETEETIIDSGSIIFTANIKETIIIYRYIRPILIMIGHFNYII